MEIIEVNSLPEAIHLCEKAWKDGHIAMAMTNSKKRCIEVSITEKKGA